MIKQLTEVLSYLIVDKEMHVVFKKVCGMCNDMHTTKQVINELDKKISKVYSKSSTGSDPFDTSPCLFLLMAYAYSYIGDKDAVKFSDKACSLFKFHGKEWNEAIGRWFLGIVLLDGGQAKKARTELGNAINILNRLAESQLINGLYKDRDTCQSILEEIKHFEKGIDDFSLHPLAANEEKTVRSSWLQLLPEGQEGYLFMPQLPTYNQVQAGSDGPIWVAPSPRNAPTETDQVVIENQRYTVFSANRGDRGITIHPNRQYSWAKVEGNSMNKAKPTPIEAGNMVLFYQASDAPENAFVIASYPVVSGAGYMFLVKRWNAAGRKFISDSSEPGHHPIPCDKENRIMGIVTAVAKRQV